jgi:hypothetical protein
MNCPNGMSCSVLFTDCTIFSPASYTYRVGITIPLYTNQVVKFYSYCIVPRYCYYVYSSAEKPEHVTLYQIIFSSVRYFFISVSPPSPGFFWSFPCYLAGILLCLDFNPEDGGDMSCETSVFRRNTRR